MARRCCAHPRRYRHSAGHRSGDTTCSRRCLSRIGAGRHRSRPVRLGRASSPSSQAPWLGRTSPSWMGWAPGARLGRSWSSRMAPAPSWLGPSPPSWASPRWLLSLLVKRPRRYPPPGHLSVELRLLPIEMCGQTRSVLRSAGYPRLAPDRHGPLMRKLESVSALAKAWCTMVLVRPVGSWNGCTASFPCAYRLPCSSGDPLDDARSRERGVGGDPVGRPQGRFGGIGLGFGAGMDDAEKVCGIARTGQR